MQALLDLGIAATGLDNYPDLWTERLYTAAENLLLYDVRTPLTERFPPRDLVVSMEVGEHLEERYAETFVTNLCHLSRGWIWLTCSDTSGIYHLNVRSRYYWIRRVEAIGTHCYRDDLSVAAMERFWEAIPKEELVWLKRSVMIFRRQP